MELHDPATPYLLEDLGRFAATALRQANRRGLLNSVRSALQPAADQLHVPLDDLLRRLLRGVRLGITVGTVHGEAQAFASERGAAEATVLDVLMVTLDAQGSACRGGYLDPLGLRPPSPIRHSQEASHGRQPPPGKEVRVDYSIRNHTRAPVTLDKLAPSLTERARSRRLAPLHGRALELRRVIGGALGAVANNVVILGAPGVGKTALAMGLATRNEELPPSLQRREIRQLDMDALLGSHRPGGFLEDTTGPLFAEIATRRCVLVVDDIARILGASSPGGGSGLLPALRALLSNPDVPVIATCNEADWSRHIDPLPSFARLFRQVLIEEPTPAEAQGIGRAVAAFLSRRHGLTIQDEAVVAAVELGRRYMPRERDPSRTIKLLDGACAAVLMARTAPPRELAQVNVSLALLEQARHRLQDEPGERAAERVSALSEEIKALEERREEVEAEWAAAKELDAQLVQAAQEARTAPKPLRKKKNKRYDELLTRWRASVSVGSVVDADAVASVVADQTGVPAARVKLSEAERLLRMEEELHAMVVGQDAALGAVARAVRRSRAGLQPSRRPIAAFLFRGPSGVGKTETARALAQFLFSDPDALVRIDMSEFAERHNLARLTGSAPGLVGYDEGGVLTNAVLTRPMSVVLLDEVEKGHPDCMNLFLQVLDAGSLTDSKGRSVSFRETVIILTTNLPDDDAIRRWFRPEFLGRLDAILAYDELTPDQLQEIAARQVDEVAERLSASHGATLDVDGEVVQYIVERVLDPRYGARPIRGGITSYLVDPMTDRILREPLAPGSRISARLVDGAIQWEVA